MNPYLAAKREAYEQMRQSIKAIQTRAAEADRDMTEDELESVREQSVRAQKVFDEIEMLTAIENRNEKFASNLPETVSDQPERPAARTAQRPVDYYNRDSGRYSFFVDSRKAQNDPHSEAAHRLQEHSRALDTAGEGIGLVPPKWMTDEFERGVHDNRVVADAVRKVDLGNDPRPMTMPRQTARATVVEQPNEGTGPSFNDEFNSDAGVTVNPTTLYGAQEVTRQMLDSANPAIDQMIWDDLAASYNDEVEKRVIAAMAASAGTPVKSYATEAAWSTAVGSGQTFSDDVIDAEMAVRIARKANATGLILGTARYGDVLKLKDNDGRPLVVPSAGNARNAVGERTGYTDGWLGSLPMLVTGGIDDSTYPAPILAARLKDTILFEGTAMQFKFEEVKGPQLIRIGLWRYVAVHVQYAGASVKKLQVTAAS